MYKKNLFRVAGSCLATLTKGSAVLDPAPSHCGKAPQLFTDKRGGLRRGGHRIGALVASVVSGCLVVTALAIPAWAAPPPPQNPLQSLPLPSVAGTAPKGGDRIVQADGDMYEALTFASGLARIDPVTGHSITIACPSPCAPAGIVAGPDHSVWFSDFAGNALRRLDLRTQQIDTIALPDPNADPADLTIGPDHALWFAEAGVPNAIARLDLSTHALTSFPIPSPNSMPSGITVGRDGNIWFTEQFANNADATFSSGVSNIGRLLITAPHTITEFRYLGPPTAGRHQPNHLRPRRQPLVRRARRLQNQQNQPLIPPDQPVPHQNR